MFDKHKTLPIVQPSHNDLYCGFKGISAILAREKNGMNNPDYYIASYDGAIKDVDEEIGKILNILKKLRLEKRTIIIITSDHGELLGDHGYYFTHSLFLYESLIRVPLIIKCEGIIPKGKIVSVPVKTHLDIAPTLLDILKIDKPKSMEGVSLLETIVGKRKYPCSYIFAHDGYNQTCVRTDEWKLIRYHNEDSDLYELFNLKEDPLELHNLISLEKNQFEALKTKLGEYHYSRRDPILNEEIKEQLKSLGYLH